MTKKVTIMTDLYNTNTSATLRALLVPWYSELDVSKFKDYEIVEPKKGYPYPRFFQHCDGKMALDFYKRSGYDINVLKCQKNNGNEAVLDEELVLSQNIKDLGRIIINIPYTFHNYSDIDGRLKQFFEGTDIVFALYPGLVDAWLKRTPTQDRGRELEKKLGVRVSARDLWTADPSNGYDYHGFFMLNPLASFTGCHP